MRLRRRLVVTMVVLVIVALGTTSLVTLDSLHSYLYGRTDQQLEESQVQVDDYVLHADQIHAPVSAAIISLRVSPLVYVEILGLDGQPVVVRPSGTHSAEDPAPRLPAVLPTRPPMTRAELDRMRGSYHPDAASIDVPSVARGGPEYRLQATALPGGTLVVATSLVSVNDTLRSLRNVELGISAVVLAVLIALVTLFVSRGLRPLDDMTETAGAIAAGDLTRRVDPEGEKGEIGRLGTALNGMLSQIEAAFVQRTRSEERLRDFLADASHELRTPLTSIRGYAELIRKDALDEDGRERALERIESESARMGRIVENLLALARADDAPGVDLAPVDIVPVVAGAVDDARALGEHHRIALEAPAPVVCQADGLLVGQIAQNLLQNAVGHTPPATPIEVEVMVDGGVGVLRVRDHGPGLTSEQADRVFERFYRAAPDNARRGTGLGLTIVAALVNKLGGTVSVDSAPGRGTCFEVRLRLDVGPAVHPAPPSRHDPSPGSAVGPLRSTGPDGTRTGPLPVDGDVARR